MLGISVTRLVKGARQWRLLLCSLLTALVFTAHAGQSVTVDYVIDGDTVVLASGERVRLLGINTPEISNTHKNTPAEPLGERSRKALVGLVEKQRVELTVGSDSRDHYGRTLGYLTHNGVDIQQELLLRGYAMVVAIPPNLRHLERYIAAESDARKKRKGVWGHPYFSVQAIDKSNAIKTGFSRIRGTVTKISNLKKKIRITVADQLHIIIPRHAWRHYWKDRDADELLGTQVTARGWISARRGKKQMWVSHPFMLRSVLTGVKD